MVHRPAVVASLVRTVVLASCATAVACDGAPTPTGVDLPGDASASALTAPVIDLAVTRFASRSLTLSWTQVDDGTGEPARYRVKYGAPLASWSDAAVGCRLIVGDVIGQRISCDLEGLDPVTEYEIQLAAFKVVDGTWIGATRSNVATGSTTAPTGAVDDLRVTDRGPTFLAVRWTQVDDGTGQPARYRLKYTTQDGPPWREHTLGCDVIGDRVGDASACVVDGLSPLTDYLFRLQSYRVVDGLWVDARYSNRAVGTTTPS